jgi:hypothetical protein
VLPTLAGVVHDRQRADSHEHNRDEENDQEALHIDLTRPADHPPNLWQD